MRDLKHASVFVTPAAIIAVCISALPLLYIFYTSLHGPEFSLDAYTGVLQSALFRRTLSSTMVIAVSSTALSLLIGYAIALHLARQPERRRAFLMILLLLPFWTSVLVKCYAFTIILGRTGIVNSVLDVLSGGQVSVKLLLNRAGVLIGMTNYLTPFVVFPVLASLLAIDPSVYRLASIMGAGPQRIFCRVTSARRTWHPCRLFQRVRHGAVVLHHPGAAGRDEGCDAVEPRRFLYPRNA